VGDDEDAVAEAREHALGLVSLRPREPSAGERRSQGVRAQEDGADEAQADPDDSPAEVVGRGRDLGPLPNRDQSGRIRPLAEGNGDRSVFEAPQPDVGRLSPSWKRVDSPDTVLANEPTVEQEAETAVGKARLVGQPAGQARSERGHDENTPDRPLTTADDLDARVGLPSVQSAGRALAEHDPRVLCLDCPERPLVAPSKRASDPSGLSEPVGGATRVV
jgi:hypothetical protein